MSTTASAPRLSSYVRQFAAVGVVILIIAIFSVLEPNFFTAANFVDILRSISVSALLALGVTSSLVVDGFDVSIGSMASLAVIAATAAMVYYRQELVVAIALPLLLGAIVGLINSFLIIKLHFPDLLATLAMLFVINGVQMTYTNGYSIYPNSSQGSHEAVGIIVPSFLFIGQGDVWGIPFATILLLIVVIIGHLFLNRTTTGRFMYLVGSNPEAARHIGLPLGRLRTLAYVISGVLSALGGIVLASRIGGGQVSAGASLMTDAVASAYVGFAIFGRNRPSVVGTLLGALLIGILLNGLTMLNVPYYAQDIVKGGVFIVALAFAFIQRRGARR